LYVCYGNRTIDGLLRFRGEVLDGSGLRNMDILVESSAAAKVPADVETVDIEHEGHTRRFIDDEHASVFIEWVAAQPDPEPEAPSPEADEPGPAPADADANGEGEGDVEIPPYTEWTKAQLAEELDVREIAYHSNDTKAELIALLEADDAAD
jgi:hypothetical protein